MIISRQKSNFLENNNLLRYEKLNKKRGYNMHPLFIQTLLKES